MTHPQKSPIAEASLLFPGGKMKLLRLGGKQSIFEVRVQDKQSISHKPTYLAIAGHVVSSLSTPWACSVSWDQMVSRVKCESHPSVKPSVKRFLAKMTSMAPKSMKTVIKHPMPDFVVGYGSF